MKLGNNTKYVLFIVSGTLLIVTSTLLRQNAFQELSEITLSLGIVVLAVVLVDYLWDISGGHPMNQQLSILGSELQRLSKSIDLIETSKKVGLKKAYDSMGNFGKKEDWINLIMQAKKNVDVLGRTMHGWTRAAELKKLIVEKIVKDNVKFRWLIMDKDNRHIEFLTESGISMSEMVKQKLESVHHFLCSVQEELPKEYKDFFEVRFFTNMSLYCSILKVDNDFYIMQYLYSMHSNDAPFYCIEGPDTAWATVFNSEFEIIWSNAHEMHDNKERRTIE